MHACQMPASELPEHIHGFGPRVHTGSVGISPAPAGPRLAKAEEEDGLEEEGQELRPDASELQPTLSQSKPAINLQNHHGCTK